MNIMTIAIAAAVFGIDAGWQPLDEGGVEYIIQIDPRSLELLRSGEDFISEIPEQVSDIRRYRITLGARPLPKRLPTVELQTPPRPPTREFPDPEKIAAPRKSPLRQRMADTQSRPQSFEGPADEPGPDASGQKSPGVFEPAEDSRPLVQDRSRVVPAAHHQDIPSSQESPSFPRRRPSLLAMPEADGTGSASTKLAATVSPPATAPVSQPGKPWLPFTASLLLLFGSLGGNVYLVWLLSGQRALNRQMTARFRRTEPG